MEVVAVAALAILGYELKGRGPRKSGQQEARPKRTMFFDDKHVVTEPPMVPFTPREYSASMPYHNNMVPFFSSQGAQNTSDNVKQARLNTFTGTDDDFHKKKVESASRVSPEEGRTNIYGNPVMGDEERMRAFSNPLYYNNVNSDPFSNQLVGPGLGVGTSVASAGGFHPESVLRVLPDNVNEYRVNQLDSLQPNVGAAAVTKASDAVGDSVRELIPRYYEEAQHPTMPTGGVVTAQTAVSDLVYKPTLRGTENEPLLWGAAPSSNVEQRGSLVTDYTPHHGKNIENCGRDPTPATNIGPSTRSSMYYLPETDREMCTPILNLLGPSAEVSRDAWDAKTTLRQCTPCTPMTGPVGVAVSASTSRADQGGRLGPQVLSSYTKYQNYGGQSTSYVPIGQTVCKAQTLNSCRVENPSWKVGNPTGLLSEYDIGGREEYEFNYHGQHGQGPQQLVNNATYEMNDDSCFNRAPHQSRVYDSRAEIGEVELR